MVDGGQRVRTAASGRRDAMIMASSDQHDLGVHRHVRFQLVIRILDLDLDPVNQLHALLLGLDLLGRELGFATR